MDLPGRAVAGGKDVGRPCGRRIETRQGRDPDGGVTAVATGDNEQIANDEHVGDLDATTVESRNRVPLERVGPDEASGSLAEKRRCVGLDDSGRRRGDTVRGWHREGHAGEETGERDGAGYGEDDHRRR